MVGWNLNPFDAVFLDQPLRLAHAELALVRIDADKGNQHVGIFRGDLKHLGVVVTAEAGLAFGVDRKDHRGDFFRAIICGRFLHRRRGRKLAEYAKSTTEWLMTSTVTNLRARMREGAGEARNCGIEPILWRRFLAG
jgi:hypothetical protein